MSKIEKDFQLTKLVQEKKRTKYETIIARNPESVAKFLIELIGFSDREKFVVLFLDSVNRVIGYEIAHIGSLNASVAHPREIFKSALLNGEKVKSIIISHSHPNGNCTPSPPDVELTKRLNLVGKLLNIDLLDHIIVSDRKHISMKEKGYY